jgi:hypothetical protein
VKNIIFIRQGERGNRSPNGLNVREVLMRLKVGKTALYAALQSASAADS